MMCPARGCGFESRAFRSGGDRLVTGFVLERVLRRPDSEDAMRISLLLKIMEGVAV
jgi:hypothetical protein